MESSNVLTSIDSCGLRLTDVNTAVLSGLIDDAYESVKMMIYKIVNKYQRRHGGEFDELLSVAHEAFMEAVWSFDPNRGKFTTHVWNRVTYKFKDEAKLLRKGGGFVHEEGNASLNKGEEYLTAIQKADPDLLKDKKRFDLQKFLGELSQEAREAAEVALSIGSDNKGMSLVDIMSILVEAEWTAAEILKAFKELKEALL